MAANINGVQITISANNQISPVLRSIQGELEDLGGSLLGLRQPFQVFELFQESFGGITGAIVETTSTIGFFGQGMSALQGLVSNGPFQLLIGQTIELQDQLLSTAATLVGTSKIISNGFEIKDAQQAILSLNQPLNDQIRQLKQESLELVGVTSKELVPVFQQVASGITPIGASLTDARGLTLSFAAALGTLQVPLYQSQQEIQSIFQGNIDQNSVLAKSLSINNDMVNKWKAQGTLVSELTKRLEPFRAGNKLASQSFAGVTSNIQEVFDLIGQKAGEKLLVPLVQGLTEVYDFLNVNTELIVAEAGKVTDQILRAGLAFQSILKTIFGDVATVFKDVPLFLFTSLANALEALNEGLAFTMSVLRPALNLFSALSSAIAPVASGFLVIALQAKALVFGVKVLTSAFGVLGNVLLPGVGQLLPLVAGNAGILAAAFTNLGGASVFSATGATRLFTNLQQIPGAMTLITAATAALSNVLKSIGVAVVAFAAFKVIDEFILKNKGLMEVLGGVFGGLGEVVNILIGSWQSALITSTIVVGGLAIAFRAQLIPAVLSFVKIQLAGVVGSATTAFTVLSGVLGSLGLSGMAVSAGSAASSLVGLSTAASAGTLTIGGLATAMKGLLISTATLLAPLTAVAAVVGGIGLILYSKTLEDSTEATEVLADRTEEFGDLAIDSIQQLSAARKKQQESEKLGIRLTDEEYKNNQKLQNQAKLRVGLIEDQISALKEQEKTVKGDANKANIQSQITELEKLKTSLNEFSSDIKIEPKDLPILGSTLEQLKKKADQAMKAILKPSGDQEIFKSKASEVIEFNMALLEMGQTIDKDVIAKLRQLANDTRLDQEVQREAQETITKVIQSESEERLAVIGRQKAEVEALQKNGEVGAFESEKQITALTIKELEERKSAQQQIQSEQQSFGNTEAAEKAGEEIKKIEADITKAVAEERSKRNAELIKNFEEQQSIIEGYLAQGLGTEERFNAQKTQLQLKGLDEQIRQQQNKLRKLAGDDKEGREAINAEIGKLQVQRQKIIKEGYDQELSTLEKQLQKTVDLVKEAELERQIERQKAFNQDGGDQTSIEEENTRESLKTIEVEYNKTIEKLNKMKAQSPLSDPRLEADRQTEIRKLRQQGLQQSLEFLKTEKAAWDAHTEFLLAEITRENNARLLGIEKQINGGKALRELSDAQSASDKVRDLQTQLSREKDINNQASLRLEIEKALGSERAAWKQFGLAEAELENTKELNQLSRDYLAGKISQNDIALQQAKDNLELIELEAKATTDKKGIVEIEKKRLEAVKALREAEKAKRMADLEAINNIELIGLKGLLNKGKILREEYDLKVAQQSIKKIEERLSLETDVNERIKIQLELTEAQGSLIDANVKLYEAKLNKESQQYENSIKRQNKELDSQTKRLEGLTKAFQMRSELQDAQKGVFDAASSFYQGELDALVQGERSERKKKQLAELIAGIKLKSVLQQAQFEEQSLIMQQQMKTIEIEREKIAARRALNDAKIEKRKADNALKVAKKDPRTTPEQLEELQTAADIAGENVGYQEQNLRLLQRQQENQDEIFKLQRRELGFRNKGMIRSAQLDVANNTANPALKRQRLQEIREDVLSNFGVDSVSDLTSRSSATANQALRESGLKGSTRLPGGLSTEEQMRSLRGDTGSFSGATGTAGSEIYRLTGGLSGGGGGLPQSREPLMLPAALTPSITPSISQDLSRALQQTGVGKVSTTIAPVINIPITVNGDQKVGESIKKQVEPRLENVIQQMVTLSRS